MSAADLASGKPRAWQRMLSGRRLDLLDPNPADVEISDIAHGLARVARWNGQTVGEHAFSVAQHALLVEAIASTAHWADARPSKALKSQQLAALLHDAAEYVVGDLISPFKAALGVDYKQFENRLLRAIHARFLLPAELEEETAQAIKQADQTAAYFEATLLAGFEKEEALRYFGNPDMPGLDADQLQALLVPWSTAQAQKQFLDRFSVLFET